MIKPFCNIQQLLAGSSASYNVPEYYSCTQCRNKLHVNETAHDDASRRGTHLQTERLPHFVSFKGTFPTTIILQIIY